MSAARLWRRGLARLPPSGHLASRRDAALLASAGEFEANDRALHDLLARDGRDTEDVPGFDALADRQAELVEQIIATPARGLVGAVAKARCARLRPHERGFDAALGLALSVCDDLLSLPGGRPPRRFRSPLGLSRDPSRGAVAGGPRRPHAAGRPGDGRRSAAPRLGDLWRCLVDALIQVGAWSLAGAAVLPLCEVHLRWAVVAFLLAVGGSATFLASWLRHTDRSA